MLGWRPTCSHCGSDVTVPRGISGCCKFAMFECQNEDRPAGAKCGKRGRRQPLIFIDLMEPRNKLVPFVVAHNRAWPLPSALVSTNTRGKLCINAVALAAACHSAQPHIGPFPSPVWPLRDDTRRVAWSAIGNSILGCSIARFEECLWRLTANSGLESVNLQSKERGFSDPVSKRTFETMAPIIKSAIFQVHYEVVMALMEKLRVAFTSGPLENSFKVLAFDGSWSTPRQAPHHCLVVMFGRIPILILTISKCEPNQTPDAFPVFEMIGLPPFASLGDLAMPVEAPV